MPADEALLLIGHGSARYPDAGAAMFRHAETLRRAGRFDRVEAGLLNGQPSVAEALARIGEATPMDVPFFVVPFFMEDGYFTRVEVPRALGGRSVIMGAAVGLHDGMAGLIERQALAGCAGLGISPGGAAVLVVGHGSASAPGQALALHRHASRVAATELFVRVEAACLEEAPFAAGTLAALRNHPVVVIGFFAGSGGHVRDDLPALIAAERAARGQIGGFPADGGQPGLEVRFHGCVTDDPAMTEIIMDQASNAQWGE